MHIRKSRARRAISVVAVAGVAALALTACTTSGSTSGSTAATGGTVTVAVVNDLTSLNPSTPQGNVDTNGQVGYLDGSYGSGFQYIDDKYTIVHDDKFGTFKKTSDDPLTVTYTLNKADKWSDGEPVTADDMVLGWAMQSGYYDSATFDQATGEVTSGRSTSATCRRRTWGSGLPSSVTDPLARSTRPPRARARATWP